MITELYSGGTMARLVVDAIERFGCRPLIADDHVRWTYAEFGQEVGRILSYYRSIGLKRGEGVALLTGNRAEAWAVTCASAIYGLRHTHLHPLAAEADHAHILADSQASTLIVDGRRFADRGAPLRKLVPSVARVLSLGPAPGSVDLLTAIAGLEPEVLIPVPHPEDTLLLTYTGGTTGKSKGIIMPHRAVAAMSSIMASEWEWPQDLGYLAMSPISHSAGIKIYPIMLRGGFTRLIDGFDAERLCQVVSQEKLSVTFLVPTMLNVLLERPDLLQRYDLSSLKLIIYGAAPMAPDQMRRAIEAFGPIFLQLYGQSEAPECVTTMRCADHDLSRPERLAACGRATALTEIALFDAQMNEVPLGEPGELCVRGPLVMKGYWNLPDATAEALRGGWLHTGDVARKDADGFFYIVDRTKDMIISGGFNIYPREVEDCLCAHPAVSGAAVIGIPDAKWGEAVTAFVVLREGHDANVGELTAYVKAHRGGPWAPKSIHVISELPLTGLGKLDRKTLRAPYWVGQERGV